LIAALGKHAIRDLWRLTIDRENRTAGSA